MTDPLAALLTNHTAQVVMWFLGALVAAWIVLRTLHPAVTTKP